MADATPPFDPLRHACVALYETQLGDPFATVHPVPVVVSPPSVAPAPTDGVVDSYIDGEFTGWDGETVFRLQNGQIWQQASYAYTYSYAYNPPVLIYPSGRGWRIQVDGVTETVQVPRLRWRSRVLGRFA
jgi:hypothetical protein